MIEKSKLIEVLQSAKKAFLSMPKEDLLNHSGIGYYLKHVKKYKIYDWFDDKAKRIVKPPVNKIFWFCNGRSQLLAYIWRIRGCKTSRSSYCGKLIKAIKAMDSKELAKYNIKDE